MYNILAAYAGVRTAGFAGEHFGDMLRRFNPENGRMEQFRIKGTGVTLNLAKNPAGFNQNILCGDAGSVSKRYYYRNQ